MDNRRKPFNPSAPLPKEDLTITKHEIRERAFFVWYKSSRNDKAAVRDLKKEGLSISRQTIGVWKKSYDWLSRAEALDLKKSKSLDAMSSLEDTLLAELTLQKDRYRVYFDSLPAGQVDNQATYAYSQLCRQIADITEKIKKAQCGLNVGEKEAIDLTIKFVDGENQKGA